MKPAHLLALLGLAAPLLAPQQERPPRREKPREEQEGKKPAMTRFFEEEAARLTEELEGSWMLADYLDPISPEDIADVTGFVTFHEGFMTWILSIDTIQSTWIGLRALHLLESGAYRYHVDEQANLQLASVMSFTNNTENGEVMKARPGDAFEYFTNLEDGVLELRDTEGITMSFRKVEAGEFPDAAGRLIEKQRSGTPQWDVPEQKPR
ncbi:MAG TPA: hypothetical protein VF530_00380 [Planctomycetota bacterium]